MFDQLTCGGVIRSITAQKLSSGLRILFTPEDGIKYMTTLLCTGVRHSFGPLKARVRLVLTGNIKLSIDMSRDYLLLRIVGDTEALETNL